MTNIEKVAKLKILLGIIDSDQDEQLGVYLDMAKNEILNWLYSNCGAIPSNITDVPVRYEQVQIQSCIAGFNLNGAEGQATHSENGISRTFRYADMLDYIHANVYPYIGVNQ